MISKDNIIILLGITYLIVSCVGEKPKEMRIFENTEEFINIQNSLEISFSQAKIIFEKYHNENEYNELDTLFYYFQDGYYYFGYMTDPTNDKQNRPWYFLEAKIDGKTGTLIKLDKQVTEWRK